MCSLEEALERILAAVLPLPVEPVPARRRLRAIRVSTHFVAG